MKLHRISLENLNSLYGKHTVDFDADLRGAPLFLIVGPTGAGKSTVMDAVSLALFARTPRLAGNRGDDPRLTMSRGTGSCFAEVVFSKQNPGQARRYFRAAWMCRRARDKATGKLQSVRRTLYEIDEAGAELAKLADDTVAKRYEQAFNDVLEGLTPAEFQRSMLLAQGQFSAFLHATVEERATILERLTNTEIYRDIGARAFARWQEASRVSEGIRARADAITVLTEQEFDNLKARLSVLQTAVKSAESEHAAARARSAWFERRAQLQRELADTAERLAEAQALWEAGAPKREQIAESERCAIAGEAWKKLRQLQHAAAALRQEIHAGNEAIAQQSAALEAGAQALQAALESVEAATNTMQSAAPKIVAASDIQSQLDALERDESRSQERSRALERVKAALAQAQRELAEHRTSIAQADTQHQALLEARDTSLATLTALAERWGTADANPPTLRAHLRQRGGVIEQGLEGLNALQRAVQSLQQHEGQGAQKKAELERGRSQAQAIDQRLATQEAAVVQHEAALADEADHLQTARIALKFVDARRHLETGKECPVCGATEHPRRAPDAADDPLADDAREAEERAASLEAKVREREAALKQARAAVRATSEERATVAARIVDAEAALSANQAAIQAATQQRDEALATVSAHPGELLSAAGLPSAEAVADAIAAQGQARAKLNDESAELDRAIGARESAGEALEAHRTATREARAKADALRGRIDALSRDLAERSEEHAQGVRALQDALERVAAAIRALQAEGSAEQPGAEQPGAEQPGAETAPGAPIGDTRAQLLTAFRERMGYATPGAWKDALQQALDSARARHAGLATSHARAVAQLEAQRSAATERSARLVKLDEEIARDNTEMTALLQALELPDTAALAARVLRPEQRAALAQEVAALTSKRDEARGQHGALQRQLKAHEEATPPGLDTAETDPEAPQEQVSAKLVAALDEAAKALEALRNERAEVEAQVKQQLDDRARLSDTIAALDAAEKDVVLWDEMRTLIGVSNGSGFQRYAQTLNLAELIDKANIRLRELAPRYSLVVAKDKDGNPELEFAIMDHDHGDRVRPQTTLSGGETFLVSLALALALSEYRQTQMPIETLLLDEGFGTLDADTLDIAMSALERICAVGGTQIGVISHVEALRERIGAQVVVDKLGAGRSRLRVIA